MLFGVWEVFEEGCQKVPIMGDGLEDVGIPIGTHVVHLWMGLDAQGADVRVVAVLNLNVVGNYTSHHFLALLALVVRVHTNGPPENSIVILGQVPRVLGLMVAGRDLNRLLVEGVDAMEELVARLVLNQLAISHHAKELSATTDAYHWLLQVHCSPPLLRLVHVPLGIAVRCGMGVVSVEIRTYVLTPSKHYEIGVFHLIDDVPLHPASVTLLASDNVNLSWIVHKEKEWATLGFEPQVRVVALYLAARLP
jgi:hypothetical protein